MPRKSLDALDGGIRSRRLQGMKVLTIPCGCHTASAGCGAAPRGLVGQSIVRLPAKEATKVPAARFGVQKSSCWLGPPCYSRYSCYRPAFARELVVREQPCGTAVY